MRPELDKAVDVKLEKPRGKSEKKSNHFLDQTAPLTASFENILKA